MSTSRQILKNESGVAMLMALTTITILAVLAGELVYETEVYHKIVYNNVDQLRAHHLAKSGLKLAKLQIVGAKKAMQMVQELGKNAPVNQTDIDQIWQTPIILPPPLPPKADMSTRDAVKTLTDDLDLPGIISVNISGESGKLNLNRLVWKKPAKAQTGGGTNNPNNTGQGNPSTNPNTNPNANPNAQNDQEAQQQFRKTITAALEQMLKQKKDSDNEFLLKYEALTAENLIGNILAWIDPKTEVDGESAPKEGYYRELQPPYAIKNAPLFSMSELHMVKDFDDTLVEFMSNYFTAMITEGVNVNAVDDFVIKALFPNISDENLQKLAERRKLTGFNKEDDFWKFMQELGFGTKDKEDLDNSGITITTSETAFRVAIDAKSGDANKSWVAHMGPLPPKLTQEQKQQPQQIDPNQNIGQNEDPNKPKTNTASNDNSGPVIVYLRTD